LRTHRLVSLLKKHSLKELVKSQKKEQEFMVKPLACMHPSFSFSSLSSFFSSLRGLTPPPAAMPMSKMLLPEAMPESKAKVRLFRLAKEPSKRAKC
jgi:hypothetical protein